MYKQFIIFILCLLLFVGWAKVIRSVVVEVYNPYPADIMLNVKCDWKEGRPKFKKSYVLKRNSKLQVPLMFNNCQIHPKIIW